MAPSSSQRPAMAWLDLLQTRYAALGVREQRGLLLAALALATLLLWSVALAPALRTLQSADAQNAQLASTLERMQALQTRALALQATPLVAPQESLKALKAAADALGKAATLQVIGEQATLSLKQVSAQSLAPWLAPLAGSGPSPFETHLQRDASSAEPLWSGTLVFRLPAQKPAAQ